jgi:hypothetical protein
MALCLIGSFPIMLLEQLNGKATFAFAAVCVSGVDVSPGNGFTQP